MKNYSFNLDSADQTAALAHKIAPYLRARDILLLHGEIGTGKTHFARSVIQARQAKFGPPEDIPSPTFTLVQTYPIGELDIWHADLYRLSGMDEIVELGLTEAFENAICLVEWPDRLGVETPARHLSLTFEQGAADDARLLTITSHGADWAWLKDV